MRGRAGDWSADRDRGVPRGVPPRGVRSAAKTPFRGVPLAAAPPPPFLPRGVPRGDPLGVPPPPPFLGSGCRFAPTFFFPFFSATSRRLDFPRIRAWIAAAAAPSLEKPTCGARVGDALARARRSNLLSSWNEMPPASRIRVRSTSRWPSPSASNSSKSAITAPFGASRPSAVSARSNSAAVMMPEPSVSHSRNRSITRAPRRASASTRCCTTFECTFGFATISSRISSIAVLDPSYAESVRSSASMIEF